jgi:putative peptidoglycan lipid II flippase
MVGTALSRVLGLVRESVMSSRFGTGGETDAFVLADNVQSTIFELTSNGVLQAAMIPALAGLAVAGSGALGEVRRAMGALLTLILAGTLTMTVLGIVFAPQVVELLTGLFDVGTPPDATTRSLAVDLVRWILPAIPLLGVASVMMAGLHAVGRPAAPAFGSATRNLIFIAATIALSAPFGVRALAIGTVLGALGIVLLQLPALVRAGILVLPNGSLGHPAVGTVIRLSIPVTASLVVTTAVLIVDRNLATGVSDGTVTSMRYATTLVQTVLGLVAAAVALAALPSLSRNFEEGDRAAFARTLRRALTFVTILIIPVTIGLAALAETVSRLVFQHGDNTPDAVDQVRIALLGYLPGTLAAGYAQVLLFAFYARKNTVTPFLIGVVAALGYGAVAFATVDRYGMTGLVVANSVQWALTAAGALVISHGVFGSLRVMPWREIATCGAGGLLVAGIALVVDRSLGAGAADASIATRLLSVVVALAVGLILYPAVLTVASRQGWATFEVPDRLRAIISRSA